jgi:preprotein translocase subunit SecG
MFSFLLVIQILVSVSIIALVMLQHGKGADMGAAFGSGSSGTVFGARGSGSFLTRATGILAAIFFINCIVIASPLLRNTERTVGGVADKLEQQVQQQQQQQQQQQAEQAAVDIPEVPSAAAVETAVEAGTEAATEATQSAPAVEKPAAVEEKPAADDVPQ